MKKPIAYILSGVFYVFFISALLFFHALQIFALKVFGLAVQKITVDALNFVLIHLLKILGISYQIEGEVEVEKKENNIVFVANHQSTYDIPPLIWYLRKFSPKFIAKKELGKGIPSISYHLKHGGNVLIDRKDAKSAFADLSAFCKRVIKNHWSVVIFPEGTRSRDGQMRPFQKGGLSVLLKELPAPVFVPISISNSWKLAKWKYFPMPVGVRICIKIHPPYYPTGANDSDILAIEKCVAKGIKN